MNTPTQFSKIRLLLLFFIVNFFLALSGFEELIQKSNAQTPMYLPILVNASGDSLPTRFLPPANIWATRKFKSKKEQMRYNKLVRNVKIAYPYAKEAKKRLDLFEEKLANLPDDPNKRAKAARKYERALKKEFKADLSNLTMSQGRILIKLIDRETDYTTYELIQEYRGNTSAIFWQSLASLFGTTLKVNYDKKEEKAIESIIDWIETTNQPLYLKKKKKKNS